MEQWQITRKHTYYSLHISMVSIIMYPLNMIHICLLFFVNSGNGPTTNGYSGQNSPSSSGQLSADGGGSGGGQEGGGQQTLISRTQKQHTTQQVKTLKIRI